MSQFTEFEQDSLKFHRRILKGPYAHWCDEWDDLPIDATCSEFAACGCYSGSEFEKLRAEVRERNDAANAATVDAQ